MDDQNIPLAVQPHLSSQNLSSPDTFNSPSRPMTTTTAHLAPWPCNYSHVLPRASASRSHQRCCEDVASAGAWTTTQISRNQLFSPRPLGSTGTLCPYDESIPRKQESSAILQYGKRKRDIWIVDGEKNPPISEDGQLACVSFLLFLPATTINMATCRNANRREREHCVQAIALWRI